MKPLSLGRFSPERHLDVCIVAGIDFAASETVGHTRIGLGEAAIAGADYPLMFLKDGDTGQLRLVALLGFAAHRNVYVSGEQWQATYLPRAVVAAPFHLAGPEYILCIDENSAKVTTDCGGALFLTDGRESAELSLVRAQTDQLRTDLQSADHFVQAALAAGLLRPMTLTLTCLSGEDEISEVIEGLYSISPVHLKDLAVEVLADLHRQDFLGAIYAVLHSQAQINRLQQLHNFFADRPILRIAIAM